MAVHRWSFLAAVLLLASLDLWCSSSSPPCSKSCTCQRAPLLNCSSSGLSSVPQLILDSITELDLSHNFLSSVTFHQPHPNLTNLWLGNNSIPHLSLCIERTVKGRHLRLRSETGSGSRCLVWAPTLQLLSAERNQLEQLPEGLDAVESLQVLQLSFNRISSLELGILGNLHQLRELHLQHNLITHLHPQMFQNLDQLKVLDLSFNMLTNMQQLTYLTLGNIGADVRLGGNRWRCDCNMRSLRRQMAYGSTRGLQAGNIVCAFPSTVSGKDLLQLDEEDLKCLGTENNLNLHQDVTVYSGAEILLSCSAQESEWWTHSGQASVNQHEARLLISDFSEGDTGLYVCVSGEDQVLSVFKLQISKTGGIRKARSLPRVHSQKSLQETTNWSTGKVTKNLSQSDLALAVCLSIFITFLVAFILGVLARPCINNLWRRVTKKKAPPATNTATSVQQRHYDNQAFSNAEEPEEIEPHRERRVTFSSVEFTEESNVQYYDTVASGDHESIRSNEVFEYQAAEVELHKHPEEKQRDDSISVDLAVERLRNMEFEHIPDPDELEERRSLSSSSDSSQNASEADQTTRDHTLPKSLHLVEDSLQTRADLSIATETEIPKTSMKGKNEFPGSPSLHTKKEYPTGSDVSHDDEELFEFSDSAQSPSVKASNLLDPFTSSVHQVKSGYDKKRPGEAPDYSSSSDSSDKEPTQTKIKQKTNKKRKKVALISKLGTHSSSSSSNSDSEENITFVNVKDGISTKQLSFQKSKTKMYDSDGSWPAVDLQHIPRLKRRLDIKALLPSSNASSSSESEDKPRGHVTKNTQCELKMARFPTNVSQTVSPKPENQKPGFELGQTGIKRPIDIKAPTGYSDSSTSSDSDDETDNVIKQRKENLLMSKLPTKVSPTTHQKPKNHWPLHNLGKTTEIKKPPSTDSDSSSSSDSDNERKHHETQKKQEELHISKLPTEVTSQKAENQWPALDLGRITRIKRRLDIKAPTAESSSSSDSGDETRGHVTKHKQEELLMSRLPAKVSPTVRPKPENRWPAPNLGKTTEIKKPLDIKAPSTDSDSSSSSDSDNERKDHMTKQKQDELHISKLPADLTTASQKKENQWPALDLGRITRIKRRLDIKAPTADADSDSSSSSDSGHETRGHVTKQKQEELLMSRLPAKVSPTVPPKPENRWPAPNLGKTTEIKKPLDIKAPSTDSDSSSSSDSDNERKDHMTKQKQDELHISKLPANLTTASQKKENQWPALDLGRITRIKRRLDIKAPTAESSSSTDSGDETRGHVIKQKQEELLMSRLPAKVSPTVRPKPENRWPAPNLGKMTEIKKPLDIKAPSTDSDSSSSSDSEDERKDHMTKQKQDELHISKLPANVTTASQKKENQWPALDFGRITRIKRRLDIKAPTAESSSSSDSDNERKHHGTQKKQAELHISNVPTEVTSQKAENQWPALDLGRITRIKRRLDIKAPTAESSSSSDSDNERKHHGTQKKQAELHISNVPTEVTSQKAENQWPALDLGRITRIKRRLDIKAPTADADSDSSSSSDSGHETRGHVTKQKQEELLMSRLPAKVSPTVRPKPENRWPAPNLGKTTEIKKPLDIKAPSTDSDSSSSSDSDNERKDHMTKQKQDDLHISKLPANLTTASQKKENQWPALEHGRITRIKRRLDIKAPTADADSDSSSSSDSGHETRGRVTKQKQEELLMSRLPAKVSPTVRPKPENRWPAPNLGKTTEIKKPLDIKAPSTDSDSSSSSDSDNERKDHMTKQKQDELHISKLPANLTTASQKKENQWPALDLGRITRIKRHLDIKAPTAESSSSSDSGDETKGHVTKQKQEELLMSRLPAKVSPTVRPKPENRWPAPNLGKMTEIKKPLDIKAPSTDSASSSSSDSEDERKDHMTKQKQDELHISKLPANVTTASQKKENQWPALDFGRITRIKRRLDIKAPTADPDSDSSSSSDSGHETRGRVTKQKQEELLMSRLPAKVSPTVRPKPENRWPAPNLGKTTEIKKPLDIKAPSTDSDSSSSSDSDNERKDHMTKQKQDELHISKLPANLTTASQKKENQWPALDFGRITRIKRRLDIKAPTADPDSDSSCSSDSEDEGRGHVMKQKQEELLMSRLPAKVSPTVPPKPENRWPAPNLEKTSEIKKPQDIKAPSTDSDSSSSSDSDNERKDHMTKQKKEELHISRDPIKTSQTVSQKQGNQWPSLDLWRIPQFKRHLDIKAPAADLDLSSSSDSEDDTSCLTENRKPRKSDVGHLSIQETTTKRYDPNGRWPTINLQDIPRIKRHLDFKAPSFKSSFSSESENETKEHVMKQKQKELLMSRLPTKISETVSCKPENHWSLPDLGKTTENKTFLDIKASSPSSDSSSNSTSEDETRGHVKKQKQEELLISRPPAEVTRTGDPKPGHQWPALDLGQIPSIKRRLDINAFIPHQSSLSSNESVDYSMTIDPSLKSDKDGHVDNKAPSPLLHVGLNIRSLGSKKSKSQSSSSDSEDENRDHRAKFRNAISFSSTASEKKFIRSQNVPGTNISFSTKTDHNIILKKYNNISGDLENMPTNDSSKTSLEVNPELQSRWAAMNLGISRFRKHLEITSHGTEPSDLTSPLPSNSPFSSSSESGSGKTQRLNKRVVDVKEIRHRGLPPVLENFQVNVSPTLKDPNDKLTFSHVVQQRINSNYSLRNTKDLTTSSNQSSHSSSSSDSEDKTKDHSETDLSRGVPRIKRRLNIKAPSPELSNSPPLLSQNENLTKHNAVQSRQASTFLGPTDESLITYKRSIFKSSLPNSSFTSSGSGHTVNYVSNLSQDGSNDRHISLASKTAPNTSFDDIIKRKLRQSRPKTDGDQLGEIKWTGVGHHLPDLSSSKLRGVNVASTSLQQASFAELTSPSNHSASGTTDINMLQLSKKSDTTPTNKFSSLGPDGESSSSSDIFHNLGNSSQITNETLMAPIGDKDRKGLNALKVMSEERRNWEADKNLTPLFDVQDGGIFSHSQSEKDIKVLSQQSQIQSPSASDSKREIDLVLLYGVPRYKRHSIGDSLMEASFPDPVTPQPDD